MRRPRLALAMLMMACGSPAELPGPARPQTEPLPIAETPPDSVEGALEPGTCFFPGQPVELDDGRSLGHLIGLEPVELLGPTDEGFRIALEVDGERVEAVVGGMIPIEPHLCLSEPATLENGGLRAELAAGSVVAVHASDGEWAEIAVAIGLRGVVRRAALSSEGCALDGPPLVGEPLIAAPRIPGLLTCLFPDLDPGERTPAAELWRDTPLVVLEHRPPWQRVRARHGAVLLEGWTPAPGDLPPAERPQVLGPGSGGFTCRRTTRPLRLGHDIEVDVPTGATVSTSRYWKNVYVPRGPGRYLHIRPAEVPEDALSAPEPGCALGAWEPWDGYMGRCFHPGVPLEDTALSPRFSRGSGTPPSYDALLAAIASVRERVDACVDVDGALVAQVAFAPQGSPRVTVTAEGTTIDADAAACVTAALEQMTTPSVEEAAVVAVTLPFFAD